MWLHRTLAAMVFFPFLLIGGTNVTSVEPHRNTEASTVQSGNLDRSQAEARCQVDELEQEMNLFRLRKDLRKLENAEGEKLTDDELRTMVVALARYVRILEERVSILENPPVRIRPVERR